MANDMMDRNNELMDFDNTDRFFNRLAGDFFGPLFSKNVSNAWDQAMKTDINESAKAYNVKIDLPGLKKSNIKIDYKNDVLTVSGTQDTNKETKDDKQNVIRSERHYGSYSRAYQLPDVDRQNIKASYDGGVLSIELPKQNPETEDQQRIEIQ